MNIPDLKFHNRELRLHPFTTSHPYCLESFSAVCRSTDHLQTAALLSPIFNNMTDKLN